MIPTTSSLLQVLRPVSQLSFNVQAGMFAPLQAISEKRYVRMSGGDLGFLDYRRLKDLK